MPTLPVCPVNPTPASPFGARRWITAALAACLLFAGQSRQAGADELDAFVDGFRARAIAAGVTPSVYDAAMKGLTFDGRIRRLTSNQPEFGTPVGDYLAKRAASGRVAAGRRVLTKRGDTAEAIARRYGVDPLVVVAIWGVETDYGAVDGGSDVLRSLASLAHLRYRDDFFANELLTALHLIQAGYVERAQLRGSWAGAMGQPQFLPSSYASFAVDADDDGRIDIWNSVPDVLGSIASYLALHGWQPGLPAAIEVRLGGVTPPMEAVRTFAAWRAMGIETADGSSLPPEGEAELVYPAGIEGPALLVTANFEAIKAYNYSDAYALSVLHLAAALGNGRGYADGWPDARPLSKAKRVAIQAALAERGFAVSRRDGRIDRETRAALRAYQVSAGLPPDGYPDAELHARLVPR